MTYTLLTALGLFLIGFRQFYFYKHLRLLKNISIEKSQYYPRVSLIVPACNEAATIGSALRSLLELEYPDFEVIAINDRSSDQTGQILAEMAREHSRLRVEHVNELPAGWIGKVHAQHVGLKVASGDWLLFTDADVHYAKDTLKKALTHCQRDSLDFLTLIPHITAKGTLLKACMSQFLISGALGIDLPKVRDVKRREAIGCGAFNLARAEVYLRSPGLEWLKMEVIDDGGFGYMMKSAGARCDVLGGLDELQLEWYPSVSGYIRGLEKNSFSIFQYSPLAVVLFSLFTLSWIGGVAAAPIIAPFWALTVLLASYLFYQVSNYFVFQKMADYPSWILLALPFSLLLSLYVTWRSMVLCLLRGGIYWRNTFYSLKELKANQRLRLIDFVFLKKFS